MATPKKVTIKASDLEKLPASIRNDPAKMALVHTILSTYTKLEAKYGYDLVLEVVNNTPAPTPPRPDAVPTLKIKGVKGRDLLFSFTGYDDWPVDTSGEKHIVGQLMMQSMQMPQAEFVDSVSTGNISGGRKTLENAFGVGEHSLNVAKGEPIRVWIRNGKRKSNVVDWNWPLEST